MEAMAGGLPVVAADAMALPHLVHRQRLLFPPGDVPALAAALGSILDDPEGRTLMGEAGREIVARHDLGFTLDTFETVYREAAKITTALGRENHEYAARSGRR